MRAARTARTALAVVLVASVLGSAIVALTPGVANAAANKLAFTTQPNSPAPTDGLTFPTQPVVTLETSTGATVTTDSSTQITLTVTTQPSGGGTLSCTMNPVTAQSGIAAFAGCAITGATGTYKLTATATSGGTYTAAASAAIVLGVGAATQLVFDQQPANTGTIGGTLSPTPKVWVEDIGGNVVSNTDSIDLSIASQPGSGATISCTANPLAATAGKASFAACQIDGVVGSYTILATDQTESVATATTSSISLAVGSANELAFTSEPPSTLTDGGVFSPDVEVSVEDAGGNLVSSNASIKLQIDTQPSTGATLSCTANTVSANLGVADFQDCTLSGLAGAYTLMATSSGLTTAVSSTITISDAPASELVFTTPPGGGVDGQNLSTQPVVSIEDLGGNVISSNASVTLAIKTQPAAGGTLSCDTTTVSAIGGVASFSNCEITGAVGSYTLIATATDLTSATSGTITVTIGLATQLVVHTSPAGTKDGANFTTQPALWVEDVGGNVETGAPSSTAAITLSIQSQPTSGAGFSCNTNPLTATAGKATFAGCNITGTIGSYTILADDTTDNLTVTLPITLTIGSATQIVFASQPVGTVVDGTTFSPDFIAALEDVGNNIETATQTGAIVLALNSQPSGGGTLSCNDTSVTVTNGLADFQNCNITGAMGAYTLKATKTGVTTAISGTITISDAPASELDFTTPPGGGVDGQNLSTQPVVSIEDLGGNVISSNASVTLAINTQPTGGGTLSCDNTTVAAVAGVATFSNCAITGVIGPYTLIATATDLTSATSGTITVTIGPATQLAFSSAASSYPASAIANLGPITLSLEDVGGNPATDDAAVTVILTSSSAAGIFAANDSGGAIVSIVIPAGQTSVTFYYGDSVVGSPTITCSATGLLSATQTETITNGMPALVAITSGSVIVKPGVAFGVTVQVEDDLGHYVSESGFVVTLTTSPAVPISGSSTLTTGSSGSAQASDIAISTPGTYEMTATAPGLSPIGAILVTVLLPTPTMTVPGAPSGLVAQATSPSGATSVTLSWTAPDDGGSPITSYTIAVFDETTGQSGATIVTDGSVLSTTIANLQAGDAYTFTVTATNAIGTSAPSASSNAVEPVAIVPVVSVSGTSSASTGTATASTGTPGAVGSISVSATGSGTVTLSQYSTPPVPNASANLSYFDIAITPGSNFSVVSFQICGVQPGGVVEWQDPLDQTFTAASDQGPSGGAAGCVAVTVTATSTPAISQLYGSIFAVALIPSPGASASALVLTHHGSSVFGAPVTYKATVGYVSGSVVFSIGATKLCVATVVNGAASCKSRSAPKSGKLLLVGQYKTAAGVVIQTAHTTLVVKRDAVAFTVKSSLITRSEVLSVGVRAKAPGSGTPRGVITVTEGRSHFAVALRNGKATLRLPRAAGVLAYSGGADFLSRQVTLRP